MIIPPLSAMADRGFGYTDPFHRLPRLDEQTLATVTYSERENASNSNKTEKVLTIDITKIH